MNPSTGEIYTIPEGQQVPDNLMEISAEERDFMELMPKGPVRYQALPTRHAAALVDTVRAMPPESREEFILEAFYPNQQAAIIDPFEPKPLPENNYYPPGTNRTAPRSKLQARRKHARKLAKARRKRNR